MQEGGGRTRAEYIQDLTCQIFQCQHFATLGRRPLRRDPDELRLPVQFLVRLGELEIQRQRKETEVKRPLAKAQIVADVVVSNFAHASGEWMHPAESGITGECRRLDQEAELRRRSAG